MRSPHRPSTVRALVAAVAFAAVAALAAAPAGRAASYPVGPLPLDRELLSNLSAPSIGPGGSSSVTFRLYDPPWFGELTDVVLQFEVYKLNGYPGDAVGPLPVANAPVLENGSASGPSVNVSLARLPPGQASVGAVTVVTSSATPTGTYAIRTALTFLENSSSYLFESRGWFTESAWENATEGPNGSGTIDPALLGVSGILPETAVYVAPSDWPVALGALVAVGLVLVGLGAWLYFRRGPVSSSGTANVPAPGETKAPSAFGRSRKRPGDSRSS